MTSEVELPIPVPDVPGADADSAGLPQRSELTRLQRLVVDWSAVADIGLRTGISTVVGAAMVPTIVGSTLRRSGWSEERDNLGPTPLSEVLTAQGEILKLIRDLIDKGEIKAGGAAEQMV